MKARQIIKREMQEYDYLFLPNNCVWRIKKGTNIMFQANGNRTEWNQYAQNYTAEQMEAGGWKRISKTELAKFCPHLPL